MSVKFVAALKIIRPLNFAISFLSIMVACLICSDRAVIDSNVLLASVAGALTGAAGNVINDIFDIKIDRINRPERVLPSGALSKSEAIVFYLILTFTSVILSSFLNLSAFIIVIISVVFLFLYSYYLKSVPLTGNLAIAFMTALAFIFGGTAAGNWKKALTPAVFAFLINFIREIIKDIEDLEGDKANSVFTYPCRYGVNSAVKVVAVSTLLLIGFTLVPFVLSYYKIEYFIVVMVTVNLLLVYFVKSLFADQGKKNLGRLSSILKLTMGLGLIAIYLGK